ncbi:deoxyguanosinetriphosphate triphosphohydrolase [Oceanibacterium hippocampi]|uniref:Deoxyguanosinetriphosphate triphosphohydrolase n=1 Tax=Oceanibacterium hippocampi TaxID=745714 RepID=A0A1Y5R8E2_9PROT|nr:deoxyguanosinetriphosphate triphosphohydrolase [Oceanibacterium hippocampi]SLN11494.1 Deoxyguanosinetriphosphate triphosphohydrolase [Oceanibacterium hippocampi]
MMDWKKLLSAQRFGQDEPEPVLSHRSPFHKDFDRVVFSSAFRRMQDKTQVHSLPPTDYVRTRLTHSMEAASVGRSLGAGVGQTIIQRHQLDGDYAPAEFGHIVSAACLTHDIGNPPFGHFGEEVIGDWFVNGPLADELARNLSDVERADFAHFEGNAQGFRIVSKLQNWRGKGGLRLTNATLATFAKYPRGSVAAPGNAGDAGAKKFGFFASEREEFAAVAEAVGLIAHGRDYWSRHPLCYLVEAADDICYRIVDLEDGLKLGRISFEESETLLLALLGRVPSRYREIDGASDRIGYLRAKSIGALIRQVVEVFNDNEAAIVEGRFKGELLGHIQSAAALDEIFRVTGEKLFTHPERLQVEVSGSEILTTILDAFTRAFLEKEREAAGGTRMSPRARVLTELFPDEQMPLDNRYLWLRGIVDYVSGMTDSFAVQQFRHLRGLIGS